MKRYNPKDIEPRWQKTWADDKIYEATENPVRPKKYVLEYFPYPSGAAMHVGHVRNYTIGDAMARHARMKGFNVLHPMGWDAFGLPAENYAIKNNISPQEAIAENTAKFKRQLTQMGFSYDWSREINSSDPRYYKWTQWFFKLLYDRGLAYQKESLQWWCDFDKTVLANEQVEGGKCWRCGNPVTKKALKQWFFKITDYADRLSEDLDKLDWSEAIKSMQRNWIGKSQGAEIDFAVDVTLKGKNFVCFHGKSWTAEGAFWPWLKKELESRGATVQMMTLPNTENPNVDEQVEFALDNFTFDDKTTVITHSLGGAVAMKLLPKLGISIESLIMVAPLCKPNFADGKDHSDLAAACDWKFDYSEIKKNAGRIIVVRDTNDYIIMQDQPTLIADNLGAELVDTVSATRHLEGEVEPIVLQQIVPGIKVFTTRPDTIYGATFMVLAPEHPLVQQIVTDEQKQHVNTYVKAAEQKTDVERQETDREKTGVFTGAYAINPASGAKIPVWVADYVLYGYGTGAIMAVPAHDERDHAFAEKFDLPIIRVVKNDASDDECTHEPGVMMNSDGFDGQASEDARENIVKMLEEKGVGQMVTNYKIRDWLISRQRYWGAPIPMIHCENDGVVPVPDEDLPVKLPKVDSYAPTGEGTSVLASVKDWVNVRCPKCGGPATRETDTMDGFACSSWYFLRFADPHNDKAPFAEDKVKFWLPVDDYIGGAEHAVMHLLYARMWTKVIFDAGMIDFDEPFLALRNQGMILAPDGRKMSKSWGNTITPDEIIDQGYGADAIRVMELFIGPWDQMANWSVEGMGGCYRFLQRIWTLTQEYLAYEGESSDTGQEDLLRAINAATKRVSNDIESMGFNTAIAALMECVNELYKIKAAHGYAARDAWRTTLETLLQLLAPFAPHITEELWQELGHKESIHLSEWPTWDEKYLVEDTLTIAVQVNGKLRGEVSIAADASEEAITDAARTNEKVATHLEGKEIKKTIYVPGKLVNFVAV